MENQPELTWHKVAQADELERDLPKAVIVGRNRIALYKIEDQVYATTNICSHARALLSQGYMEPDNATIECPVHQACFDIKTGKALTAPASDPIETYPVRKEGADIYVGLPEQV